ncbi:MAG TPA: GGDEF domain-containing protein [Thermoanaerobaculia bacterium]|jgi:diguanylate cyclase (GGDEF)-like protein|nr:GGDEF domain-containing protein [Thermoanaerobaculia bacterium]
MQIERAAARLLEPVAELLKRPLTLVDAQSAEAGKAFAVRLHAPRVAIVAQDGAPFTESERRLIQSLFDVVRMAGESEERYRELEQRMLSLQRENLDLVVRNRSLSEVSSKDSLTGLYNRWFVIEKLDSELNRSLRHGSPMSLLMLDIDHFKRINDTWGHTAGDQVLQSIGKLLRESCRVYDVPGRYGGEEFCIVLPETKPGNTTIVAERIRHRLESTQLTCGDSSIVVTASIGIAGLEAPADEILSPSMLIERADRALYSAKNRGRNRVEMWGDAVLETCDDAVNH